MTAGEDGALASLSSDLPRGSVGPMSDADVTVVIIDDEGLVRSGLSLILNASPGITVVGAASSATAVALIEAEKPDVVLLDIRMPAPDGLTILRQVMASDRPPIVAMLTTFDTSDLVLEALHRGASGFLLKDTDPELLARHVLTLADGGLLLAPQLKQKRLFRAQEEDPRAAAVATLDARETTILVEIAKGHSNAEIAAETGLPLGTVKDAVSRVLAVLGVSSRVEAAILADRVGLGPDL